MPAYRWAIEPDDERLGIFTMKQYIKSACIAASALISVSINADDEKHFNGVYIGAEGGYLDLAGIEDGGIAYNGLLGIRTQMDNGLVLGLEGTFGSADIEFLDHVWSVSGTLGMAVGAEKRGLLYIGGGYAKAKASGFGFTVTGDDYAVKAGYEHALNDTLSIRAQASTFAFDDYMGGLAFIARF